MADSDLVKRLKELDPVTVSGYDNALQTVTTSQTFGNTEVMANLKKLLGDDEETLPIKIMRIARLHDQVRRAEPSVTKERIQLLYSFVAHALPKDDVAGRAGIDRLFEALDIGEKGNRVLTEQNVIDDLPKLFARGQAGGVGGRG
jgi:hypothetical protein